MLIALNLRGNHTYRTPANQTHEAAEGRAKLPRAECINATTAQIVLKHSLGHVRIILEHVR